MTALKIKNIILDITSVLSSFFRKIFTDIRVFGCKFNIICANNRITNLLWIPKKKFKYLKQFNWLIFTVNNPPEVGHATWGVEVFLIFAGFCYIVCCYDFLSVWDGNYREHEGDNAIFFLGGSRELAYLPIVKRKWIHRFLLWGAVLFFMKVIDFWSSPYEVYDLTDVPFSCNKNFYILILLAKFFAIVFIDLVYIAKCKEFERKRDERSSEPFYYDMPLLVLWLAVGICWVIGSIFPATIKAIKWFNSVDWVADRPVKIIEVINNIGDCGEERCPVADLREYCPFVIIEDWIEAHGGFDAIFIAIYPWLILSTLTGVLLFFALYKIIDLSICLTFDVNTNFSEARRVGEKIYDEIVFILICVVLFYSISIIGIYGFFLHNPEECTDTTAIPTLFFQITTIFSVLIILSSSHDFFKRNNIPMEFAVIVLLMTFFLCTLIEAPDFFFAFVCIIGFSLNTYVLILSNPFNKDCCEAAIKYFYLSSIASGLLAFSLWLNYLIFRTLDFIIIEDTLKDWDFVFDNATGILSVAIYFLSYGLFFKLAAFPCHIWAASVYEGSPYPVMAFFVLPIKTAVLAFVFKVFYYVLKDIYNIYVYIFWFSSFFSLFFGAFAAVVEKKIKKFIAYSSINQMGFLLMGVVCGTNLGIQTSMLYLIIYVITNLCLFIILLNTFSKIKNRPLSYITDFTSFAKNNSFPAVILIIVLFSMAGIPPLVGFFGKYYVLLTAYLTKFYTLIFAGLFTSLISTYYYLKIIKNMYFEIARIERTNFITTITGKLWITLIILVILLICGVIFFDWILEIINL